MDLNAYPEPKSTSAPDVHVDEHGDPECHRYSINNPSLGKCALMKNCAKLFWKPCINVEVTARISSIYDHFIIWPSSVTLTFNLSEQLFQTALLHLKENIFAKLFCKPRINEDVMAQTSSIYGHFIICPSSVTLTFNLPEQMFQRHFYSPWRTTAKLFWNTSINVEVMTQTSSIYDHLIIWSSWPSTFLKKCFKGYFYFSRTTTVPNFFEIHW